MAHKILFRSRKNRVFAGVCGGIATYVDVDATAIRLVAIILLVLTGFVPVGIIYLLAILVMPQEHHVSAARTRTHDAHIHPEA